MFAVVKVKNVLKALCALVFVAVLIPLAVKSGASEVYVRVGEIRRCCKLFRR